MKSIKKILYYLIQGAELLGLSASDIYNAREYLAYDEFGLSFDIIVTQLYEYDIEITPNYYELIIEAGNKMDLPVESYSFTKELVRSSNAIPLAVKNKLSEIINDLNQN